MAKRITDPANPNYDFGHQFNYDVWNAETVITLTNVRWDNTYKDTVYYASDSALNAEIDSKASSNTRIENVNYAPVGRPIKINLPFNVAVEYNYVRASNPKQPVTGDKQRDYYYFILNVERTAANTTILTVELDIWQSFIRRVKTGNSYIERGHLGIAASNGFASNGRMYLTSPEPIDIGAEMVTIAAKKTMVMRALRNDVTTGPPELNGVYMDYDALIVSTVDLEAGGGTAEAPFLKSAKGGGVQLVESGASLYILPMIGETLEDINYSSWLAKLTNTPWLTQGIVSITLIPKVKRYDPNFEYHKTKPTRANSTVFRPQFHNMLSDWRNSPEILNMIPARYRHLRKFFTFPYMAVELTCNVGTSVILRPEAWNSINARVMERIAIMPPNTRIAFYPRGYNSKRAAADYDSLYEGDSPITGITNRGDGDDYGDYLGVSTGINNLPQVPAISNNAAIALASSQNSIASSRSAADWAQQKTMMSADQAYSNTKYANSVSQSGMRRGQSAQSEQLNIGQQAASDSQALNAITGAIGSTVAGATGGPAGAGVGLASGIASAVTSGMALGIQQSAQNQTLSSQQSAQRDISGMETSASNSIAFNNQKLAEKVSAGDYANTIAAIDAKVQDLQMTPPSMAGQFGGDMLNFVHDGLGVSARWKMIDDSAVARVGEYWLRFGYSLNRFGVMPRDFRCMTKFTYWKLSELYITEGNMPEFFKQAIRGIFEKGVTVWSNANDIGTIDLADNQPLSGITL